MRIEIFADILLILLISIVVAVILALVNRGKKKSSQDTDKLSVESGNENQTPSVEDY